MKGSMDLGTIFDEIFEAAENFKEEIHRNFNNYNSKASGYVQNPFDLGNRFFDENTDYYPNYSYPPMNVCMAGDRSLIFEFALAGFDENNISLSFQGDYMVFSASVSPNDSMGHYDPHNDSVDHNADENKNIRYLKHRLKMKDIQKQKYFVPMDKYAQENVKAVYKNGILKVTIPPKDEPDHSDGIKIEIIKEGN